MKSRPVILALAALAVLLLAGGAVGAFYILKGQRATPPPPAPTSPPTLTSTPLPTGTDTPTPLPEGVVVIPDTTKVLTDTTIQNLTSISEDRAVLTFSGTTDQLASLEQNDVIVGGISDLAPEGFLRKVQSVSSDGGQVVVQTGPAVMEEAIQTGTLTVTRELKPSDVQAGWALPGVKLASLAPLSAAEGWHVTLAHVVLYSSSQGDIVADGYLSFVPHLDFDLRINWFTIERLYVAARATETVDIRVTGNLDLGSVSKEVQVAYYPLSPFVVTVGPVPVVLTPILTVNVGLDGSARIGFVASVTQWAELTAGVEYANKRWKPIHSFKNEFEFVPPTITGDLQAEAYGSLRLAVLIYGVGGPYARLDGKFGLDVNLQRMPPWKLYGGLRCGVGVRAEILGYSLGNYEATVLDTSEPIAEGGTPITNTPTPTPSSTPTRTPTPTPTRPPTPTPPPPPPKS
jgi:hypothetical protein